MPIKTSFKPSHGLQNQKLKKVGDNFTISDFNSANGTWVNGGKLADTDVLFLENRDKIKLGRTEIVISIK